MNFSQVFENQNFLAKFIDEGILLSVLYVLIFIILFLFYILVFPFYVYVNKVNKERDKNAFVFPITNHFFEMTKNAFIGYIYFPVNCFFAVALIYKKSFFVVPFLIVMVIIIFCLHVITQIFYLLIIVLAFERFLLYFLKSTERTLQIIQTFIHRHFNSFYAIFAIKDALYIISWLVSSGNYQFWLEFSYMTVYFATLIFIFTSAFFYIPIMISVRKLTNLTSAKQSNPEKYIFWQTIVIFICKSIAIPIIVDFFIHSESTIGVLVDFLIISDLVTTPLIIQLSYLGCNKQNLTVLMSAIKFKAFVKGIFTRNIVSPVHPDVERNVGN
ncbi:Serpentine Receptor, class Z [Caenorhabditis elegans]|uniref:Serpentine Receptor, class Z n=1 Tax=Caenorhabditis elegans TaxID=6239 RepID=O45618_CAEEL|nr:Serpentine Receptor, class Z [Caenorhabditis elegans]CAB11539.2 Serpentine Receptor, class Z [Caenorhabditis elegans]|eukprot:NP_502707.2 Serpentine Receptor, class Z [Caenorhabditis elegans]